MVMIIVRRDVRWFASPLSSAAPSPATTSVDTTATAADMSSALGSHWKKLLPSNRKA